MKIVSVTMVKNESDIIESFVRYTLNIVDEMIILDNGSTDETLNILYELKNEKLPIFIIEDDTKYYEQDIQMNKLSLKAVLGHDADIICPVDADEFIISTDGQNPRKIIEKIKPNSYFLIKWRTYIPSKEYDSLEFIPSLITKQVNEEFESYYKVIFHKTLLIDYDAKLSMGNHNLIYSKQHESKIKKIFCDKLKIAHYPLRSKEQTMSKVLVGWPNMLSRKNVRKTQGVHWKWIFDKIKNSDNLSFEDLADFTSSYLNIPENKSIFNELKDNPIPLDFCKQIEIKYTSKTNYLNNLLENYLYFADEIHKFKNIIQEKEDIIEKQNKLLSNYKK